MARIPLKNAAEIDLMAANGSLLAMVVASLAGAVCEGVTTAELDDLAEAIIRQNGARPAFKGYRGYRHTICASVNDEVVHGIPSPQRKLRPGDIIGIDIGLERDGWFVDMAVTVGVGEISATAARLIETTRDALHEGIARVRPGAHLEDVSSAVQACAETAGFSVVRDFTGHGIGRALHEEPTVPNRGRAGRGPLLEVGAVLAIEPMLNQRGFGVRVQNNGWTVVTNDGGLSAHFEHTVAVTPTGPRILTLDGRSAAGR